MKIGDIILPSAVYGVGVIGKVNLHFLFTIREEKYWSQIDDKRIIEYTAIGGNLKQGESFTQAAKRECKEELGSDVELINSEYTLFYDFPRKNKKIIKLTEDINPVIIYNLVSEKGKLSVCSYLAKFNQKIHFLREVPALLLLPRDQLKNKESSLSDLLQAGASIIERKPIPRNAIIKPWGTAIVIQQLESYEVEKLFVNIF